MSINFPSSIDTFSDVAATDLITSAGWNNMQDAIEAVEAKVGADASAVETSLDYKLNKFTLGYLSRGLITYVDANTITIGPGAYHHSGTTDQIVYWNSTLTKDVTVSGTQWYYIYIDDSAIVTAGTCLLTATEFIESTTAPTWSATKHGWYNGSDRCIAAIRVSSGSIFPFYHDGGDYVQYRSGIADLPINTNLAARTDAALTIPAFCTRALCMFYSQLNAASYVFCAPADLRGIPVMRGLTTESTEVAPVYTNSSQTVWLEISSYDEDNYVGFYTLGWFYPVGM